MRSAIFVWLVAELLAMGTAFAQLFPSRPITLIVPFAPGGGGDITARLLTQQMKDKMVVENRPGAGGIAATQFVAKANPDGHTLLLLSNVNAIGVSLFRSLPYDVLGDFIPIAVIATSDVAVIVGRDAGLQSIADLLREARARPAKLTLGIGLIGTTQHLSAELFKARAGIDVAIVPFKSVGNLMTALTAGQIDAGFELVPAVIGQLKGGQLRALAVGSNRRFADLPEVPTVAESGVRNYEATSWAQVAAPKGTPAAVIDYLSREIQHTLAQPEIRKRYQDLGLSAVGGTPLEARELLAREVKKWGEAISTAGIERQ